jgi:serine/threonine protein kinase
MGQVYRTTDRNLNRVVAVKILFQNVLQDPVHRARFIREAKIQAQIQHHNVVQIFDADTTGESPFLVMELIEGVDLETILQRKRRLQPHQLRRLARQIGEGLDALHVAGILHRDLKPANIMIRRHDNSAVVMDLGLASLSDATVLTRTGSLLGTPLYLAPEVLTGVGWSPASDQYQMATILFEAATGSKLVDATGSLDKVLQDIVNGIHTPWPSQEVLPASIREALKRGISINPEKRFDRCVHLAQAMENSESSPSILLSNNKLPGSGHYSSPRFLSSRKRSLPALIPAGLLLMILFALTWFSRSSPPRNIRYQVIGDTLCVDYSGGEGLHVRLQVGDKVVATGVKQENGSIRLLYQGLSTKRDLPAHLIWDGGEDAQGRFRAALPAIAPTPRFGPRGTLEIRVRRPISFRWNHSESLPKKLLPGSARVNPPLPGKAPWIFEWTEEGLTFSKSWDPTLLMTAEIKRTLALIQELDPLQVQRQRTTVGAPPKEDPFPKVHRLFLKLRPWISTMLRPPLPLDLRRRFLKAWQIWERSVTQGLVLGDPLSPLSLPKEHPGGRTNTLPDWKNHFLDLKLTEIGRGIHRERYIPITNKIGRNFTSNTFSSCFAEVRFRWPSHPRKNTLVALSVHYDDLDFDGQLHLLETEKKRIPFEAWIWNLPPRINLEQKDHHGWGTVYFPGDLAPEPGSHMALRLQGLFRTRALRVRIEAVRVSWKKDVSPQGLLHQRASRSFHVDAAAGEPRERPE